MAMPLSSLRRQYTCIPTHPPNATFTILLHFISVILDKNLIFTYFLKNISLKVIIIGRI